ncbi:hypothetical protein JCM3766R1_003134 [Sporobolomyces carnicolor]
MPRHRTGRRSDDDDESTSSSRTRRDQSDDGTSSDGSRHERSRSRRRRTHRSDDDDVDEDGSDDSRDSDLEKGLGRRSRRGSRHRDDEDEESGRGDGERARTIACAEDARERDEDGREATKTIVTIDDDGGARADAGGTSDVVMIIERKAQVTRSGTIIILGNIHVHMIHMKDIDTLGITTLITSMVANTFTA